MKARQPYACPNSVGLRENIQLVRVNSRGQKSKVDVDSRFLVDASQGEWLFSTGSVGGLVVLVFMVCINSIYLSYTWYMILLRVL